MSFYITEPTFFVDKKKCKKNINRIFSKVNDSGSIFRPHFKTHQSLEVGNWFREFGVEKIAVSSLDMANYFANGGWKDITVAFPVNLREIDRINDLSAKINLNLLVESPGSIVELNESIESPVSVFIKIDTGYHRTGISPEDTNIIDGILKKIRSSKLITFSGFLSHAGHSYKAADVNEIKQIHSKSMKIMVKLKERYLRDFPGLIFSLGDTPTASHADNFHGIDEVRPGNFIFYDLMQEDLGACELNEIAVALAVPVVSKHKSRMEIVIYGGAVHLSKERLLSPGKDYHYGFASHLRSEGWEIPDGESYVSALSQEHGVVKCSEEFFNSINIGDIIAIIPVHSCLTANLSESYRTVRGDRIEKFRR
ncbi:MAG: alanine racemase [Acidobacteriota bacterium]